MEHAVIMAGGIGTRFWPLSTPENPKQLLKLFRDKSMVELTLDRIEPFIPRDRHWIVTIPAQAKMIRNCVSDFPENNFFLEPVARNTAPCIGLAAVQLISRDPDAIMVVLPADHLINDEAGFHKCLAAAVKAVEEKDAIVTLGIQPTRPETGYGYIQYELDELQPGLHRVVTFAEKPNREMAEKFINTGEFLWNSGIFVWSARRILSEIEEYIPELYAVLEDIKDCIGKPDEQERTMQSYQSIKSISIDYGVMEHARNVLVVRGTFDWSDVGHWDEVWRLRDKDANNNAVDGPVIIKDSSSSYIYSEKNHPTAVIGIEGLVVVSTSKGTLICPRERAQEVRLAAETILKKWG